MKPLRVRGLPVHPMLVHFPLATWTVATVLAWPPLFGLDEPFASLALYSNALGLASGAVAMLAGLLELAALPEDIALKHTVTQHMLLAVGSWLVYGVMLVLQVKAQLLAAALCGLLGLLLLGVAGHAGAKLVYHHGFPSRAGPS